METDTSPQAAAASCPWDRSLAKKDAVTPPLSPCDGSGRRGQGIVDVLPLALFILIMHRRAVGDRQIAAVREAEVLFPSSVRSSSTSPSSVAGDADSSSSESKTTAAVCALCGRKRWQWCLLTRITSANSAEMTPTSFSYNFSLFSLFLNAPLFVRAELQFRVFFKSNYVLSI